MARFYDGTGVKRRPPENKAKKPQENKSEKPAPPAKDPQGTAGDNKAGSPK